MELSLEGILETLLVGAIASLCLLSPFFLLFGHMFRVGALQNLFMFLLYEREEVPPSVTESTGESSRLFSMLLVVAGLFGLGVLTESFSNISSFDMRSALIAKSDKTIRLSSLDDVARSTSSTGTASEPFVRFASDYLVCRAIQRTDDAPAASIPSPCDTVIGRASGFYYTAKNAVFRGETRYQELSRLQSRIDFTRAVSMSLGVLAIIWFVAFLVAFFAEAARESIVEGRILSWHPLQKHWLRLSAMRCLLSAMALFAFSYSVLFAWSHLEEFYDKRVYGYYLSDAGGSMEIPRSAYVNIQGADPAQPFEPSAAAFAYRWNALFVANDKDPTAPFQYLKVDLEGDAGAALPLGGFDRVERAPVFGKIESLHYAEVANEPTLFAAANFDARYPGSQRIYRVGIEERGGKLAMKPGTLQTLRINGDPCRVARPDPNVEGCVIEGMTSRDAARELLLGVRSVLVKGRTVPVFSIVRLRREGEIWSPERSINATLPASYRNFGISDLAMTGEGDLLALTSFEAEPGTLQGKPHTAQVKGALWRISKEQLENGRPEVKAPIVWFAHKPEGVSTVDRRTAIVVFDDDGARKGLRSVPDTFALRQNESVYTVIRY